MTIKALTKTISITLTPEQDIWLAAHVAAGDFPSVEEAARRLIDERIAERDLDDFGDLSWAKPLVDEALAQVERGEVITLEEFEEHLRSRAMARGE